jgi:SAM-dependent methyltransferase
MSQHSPVAPCAHAQKGLLLRFLYAARNLRSRPMFDAMRRYSRGLVLDIGGLDFFLTALRKNIAFEHWTTVEPSADNVPAIDDPRFTFVACDGCDMKPIASNNFDTVFCIQVVEHVFEPNRMIAEIARVLKKGGYGVLLAPQTSTLHMLPHHYYNFTRYWMEEACRRNGLSIVEYTPLGGRWSSTASHMLYYLFQRFGTASMLVPEKRNLFFYLLAPVQILAALLLIPLCMLLSLGDLKEEANNHLVVVQKS